jgi:hypothetical protein
MSDKDKTLRVIVDLVDENQKLRKLAAENETLRTEVRFLKAQNQILELNRPKNHPGGRGGITGRVNAGVDLQQLRKTLMGGFSVPHGEADKPVPESRYEVREANRSESIPIKNLVVQPAGPACGCTIGFAPPLAPGGAKRSQKEPS